MAGGKAEVLRVAGQAYACECRIPGSEIDVTFVPRLHLYCRVVRTADESRHTGTATSLPRGRHRSGRR
jgi:hypothetical protein